jgi:hypothetical protein
MLIMMVINEKLVVYLSLTLFINIYHLYVHASLHLNSGHLYVRMQHTIYSSSKFK